MEKLLEFNCIASVKKIIKHLEVPVTVTKLKDLLTKHPDFPSLLSVYDTFRSLKMKPISAKVNESNLATIPTPFLAQVEIYLSEIDTTKKGINDIVATRLFVEVISVTDTKVCFSDPRNQFNAKEVSRELFNEMFKEIVLWIDDISGVEEVDYKRNLRKERFEKIIYFFAIVTLLSTVGFTIISLLHLQTGLIAALLLLFLKLFGTAVSVILLLFDLDNNNKISETVCSVNPVINCKAVLNSKVSKLFGIISWGELGFGYFAGSLMIFVFQYSNHLMFPFLVWLNYFTIPYVFFSIYYQYRVVKQWCLLCLSIQGIFLLELTLSFFVDTDVKLLFGSALIKDIAMLILTFVTPLLSWFLLKNSFLSDQSNKINLKNFIRLKNKKNVFDSLLENGETVDSTEGIGLTFGNPNAKYKITKVCNPYCKACSLTHPLIEQLLNDSDDVQLQIIFTASTNANDMKRKPVQHFLAINSMFTEDETKRALSDWYNSENKDYDLFTIRYPINEILNQQEEKIAAMHEWCKKVRIRSTPTFFVNNRHLPEFYQLSDLQYFLTR